MTLPADYFEEMYDASADPWSFRVRWYEQRKRDITLATLPRRRYARAFEPGCSIGLLTEGLAQRCDSLLAVDASEAAVTTAQRQLAGHPHVRVEQRVLPDGWPHDEEPFDLVVLSEVGYYFGASDLARVIESAVGSLAPDGTLLVCHWRHPVDDYPLDGDAVHAAVRARPELHLAAYHAEADFVLEVHTMGEQPSVAARDGLAP